MDEYRPDVMSVEQLFFNRNVTTAISVGQARGVALLTAANRGIQITEFTPMQIKQAVVGYGGANKEQVTFMVQKLLNIRTNLNQMMSLMLWQWRFVDCIRQRQDDGRS